ncbi:hypothetical protein [Prevotella corporis]|uniref:hypothetical protein n=1 Tax=Prevotella corporis TaxID=28128 RepID=UPI0023EF8ACA|nr:hypothetical protein [Prevotella corporis]
MRNGKAYAHRKDFSRKRSADGKFSIRRWKGCFLTGSYGRIGFDGPRLRERRMRNGERNNK